MFHGTFPNPTYAGRESHKKLVNGLACNESPSVVRPRSPDRCTEGHGFDSCIPLRIKQMGFLVDFSLGGSTSKKWSKIW